MGTLDIAGGAAGRVVCASKEAGPDGAGALAGIGDEALMTRYRNGEADAFETLYRRHGAPLYRFIGRLTRRRADADEVFQEVWFALIRGRERYEPTARFVTFLFAIAHRRVADRARRALRGMPEIAEAADDIPAEDLDPHAAFQNAQLGAALVHAIGALPLPQREAFLLQAEAGLSLDEIAQVTDVPRETVKSRLRYANGRLRIALKAWK
ncbi:MAG: sigma-70 family RNA polymerase sigma factor [Rhizomicrobium sp.]